MENTFLDIETAQIRWQKRLSRRLKAHFMDEPEENHSSEAKNFPNHNET